MAGVVIVGDCVAFPLIPERPNPDPFHRLRQAEVQHLHRAVGSHFDVRGFEIAMNDALFVRRLEGFGDLPGDRQCLVERDRALSDAVRERWPFDELHHERLHAVGFFEAVDGRNVRMVQRREHFRFALESRETLGVSRPQTLAGL